MNIVVQKSDYTGIIFDSRYTVSFNDNENANMIEFISNTSNITGWTPSIPDIDTFESILKSKSPKEMNFGNWFRQYVGFELNGTKYIWINFLSKDSVRMEDLKEN